jgi:UDP-glucuronate 4-epimerase
MKILVTGGAGFVGSHLCEALLQNGKNKVTVIDNLDPFYSKTAKLDNIKHFIINNNFKFYKIDIVNRLSLRNLIQTIKPDIVVHLAAKAGVRNSFLYPQDYFNTNVIGTINLLEAVKDIKLKNFIFGSSSSVYGERSKVPFRESDNVNDPISPYGLTKTTGEKLCRMYGELYKFPVTCLRFFTVYGPRQRPDLGIYKFIKSIENQKVITLFGDGSTYRDYTYVTDIVSGIMKSIGSPFKYEIINLGNSKPVKLDKLISMLERALNKKAVIRHLPAQTGDVSKTFADNTKARKLLNWQPKIGFAEGIGKMIEWYRHTNEKLLDK